MYRPRRAGIAKSSTDGLTHVIEQWQNDAKGNYAQAPYCLEYTSDREFDFKSPCLTCFRCIVIYAQTTRTT